jgi:hypothetical protein
VSNACRHQRSIQEPKPKRVGGLTCAQRLRASKKIEYTDGRGRVEDTLVLNASRLQRNPPIIVCGTGNRGVRSHSREGTMRCIVSNASRHRSST